MRYLFFLSFLFISNLAQADCLACWELRKVRIVLTNDSVRTGYVYWNEAWLGSNLKDWETWKNRFPESMVALYKITPERKIHMILKLFTVKNDSLFEFNVTTKAHQVELYVNQIRGIEELDKTAKKYEGAGPLPVYSLEEIKLLNTNPFAFYRLEDSVSETYYLSYNKEITRKQLKEMITETNPDREAVDAILKRKKILIVDIFFD